MRAIFARNKIKTKVVDMWVQDETHIGIDAINNGKRMTIIYPIKKFLHIVKEYDIVRITKDFKNIKERCR